MQAVWETAEDESVTVLLKKTKCYLYIVYVLQEVAYIHSKGMH